MSRFPEGLTPLTETSVEDILNDADRVGGVFSTGFDECDILTNDYWTQEAGGLPKHSLLIAKPLLEGSGLVEDDEIEVRHRLPSESDDSRVEAALEQEASHALLLRVKGPATLPNESQQTSNRHDAIRQAITTESDGVPSEADFVDALTRRELQYSGIEASVLGTFYYDENEEGEEILTFGSDVQTFFSAGHYVVSKPTAKALSWIASYPTTKDDEAIQLGDVKYSTTRVFSDTSDAPVYIDIEDFIGAKTAVLGMTRKGKSNTMKIIAAAIAAGDNDVGQLIFDPSGEYAYTNDQDECALGELYDDDDDSISTVYKFNPDEGEEGVKPIRSNLLDRDNLPIVTSYVRTILSDEDADYVENFLNTDIPSKEEIEEATGGEKKRKKRVHSAYFAVISKVLGEERLPDDFDTVWLKINDDALDEINSQADMTHTKSESNSVPLGKYRGDNQLVDFWQAAAESDDLDSWTHDDLDTILNMFSTDGQSGYKKLSDLRKFHNPDSEQDIATEVYRLLTDGELVVVDISNGQEEVITRETDRIVEKIRTRSRARFRSTDESDENLPDIQLYLEEAHRHFDTETFREKGSMNPYVELAKEGAKFNVGLTYATQEVTSIDERVLANSANWVVTHLNSDNEINELGDYYNFDDFAESIKNVEERGFVRVKTASGEYIVPTKVALFDRDWVGENTSFSVQKREIDSDDRDSD